MSATPHRFHPDAVPLIVDAFRRGIAGCHAFSAATYTLEKLAGNRVDYQRLIIRGSRPVFPKCTWRRKIGRAHV